MRYLRSQHLRRPADFSRIRSSGQRRDCGFFYAWSEIGDAQNAPDSPALRRIAAVASRRLGPAVDRNRAKRRLRELFRLNQTLLPSSCSLILVARRSILTADFAELNRRFQRMAIQLATASSANPSP